jgi:hypothetical protein
MAFKGLMFKWHQGWLARSTVFAIFFAVTGFWLAEHNLLTGQYVALVTALHVTGVGRAIASDYHERQGGQVAPAEDTESKQ